MAAEHRLPPMPDTVPITVCLLPHPATPCRALDALEVDIVIGVDRGAHLEYRFAGRTGAIHWPEIAAGGAAERRDGLWRQTCCEVFAGVPGDPSYCEFNFSPSGQWAAYAFSAERERVADPAIDAPSIRVVRQAEDAVLSAVLPAGALPPGPRIEMNVSVVVEETDGRVSYWALRHPAARPDFHQRAAFALTLDRTA